MKRIIKDVFGDEIEVETTQIYNVQTDEAEQGVSVVFTEGGERSSMNLTTAQAGEFAALLVEAGVYAGIKEVFGD